jgi:hypothetical protein
VTKNVLDYYTELIETNVLRGTAGDIGSGTDAGEALLRLVLQEYNRQASSTTHLAYFLPNYSEPFPKVGT